MERKTKSKSEHFDSFWHLTVFQDILFKIEVQTKVSDSQQGARAGIEEAEVSAKVDKLEADEEKMVLPPGKIDPEKQRFPYCIVWTPIPFLT